MFIAGIAHPDIDYQHQAKISQRELAAELGLPLGKLNYCLKAFITRGLVKINNFHRSNNKRAYAYLLAPGLCPQRIPRRETVGAHTDGRRGIRCGQRNKQGHGSICE